MASLYDRKPMATAEEVKAHILAEAKKRARRVDKAIRGIPASEKQIGYFCSLLGMALGEGEIGDAMRHEFLEYVFDRHSSKLLTMDECGALIDWLKDPHGPGPHPATVTEAWLVIRARNMVLGQQEMEL